MNVIKIGKRGVIGKRAVAHPQREAVWVGRRAQITIMSGNAQTTGQIFDHLSAEICNNGEYLRSIQHHECNVINNADMGACVSPECLDHAIYQAPTLSSSNPCCHILALKQQRSLFSQKI